MNLECQIFRETTVPYIIQCAMLCRICWLSKDQVDNTKHIHVVSVGYYVIIT